MNRSDGRLLESLRPFVQIIPYIMEKRSDAQNFSKQVLCADSIDRYIAEKRDQGFRLNYMHLFIACYVRLIAERPELNRFIMNNKIYQRNGIYISMAVKKSLSDDGQETTVKFKFTGNEDIYEITEIINKKVDEALSYKIGSDTDKLAEKVMSMPGFVKKLMVRTLKIMDKYNILPERVIDASPFHTSLFFTYLKSIDTNYIYHHLYDFGTTGIFVALGKTVKLPVVEGDNVVVKKCCQIGYTLDERICDGLYFARSFKLLEKYLEDPHLLESGLNKNAAYAD